MVVQLASWLTVLVALTAAQSVVDIGQVETLTGDDTDGIVNGPFETAKFGQMQDVLPLPNDPSRLLVAEIWANQIRVVDLRHRNVSKWAGTGESAVVDGPLLSAKFTLPACLLVHPFDHDTIFVGHHKGIRNISLSLGLVGTFTGRITEGYVEGANPQFNHACGLDFHTESNSIFVADFNNNRIRRVWLPDGSSELIAGSGTPGYQEGYGAAASFSKPTNVLIDQRTRETLWTTEDFAFCVRKVNLSSTYVSPYVGACDSAGMVDGTFAEAKFAYLFRLRFADAPKYRYVFLIDGRNHRIRRLDIIGEFVTTVAGSGADGIQDASVSYMASMKFPQSLRVARVGAEAILYITVSNAVVRVNLTNPSLYGYETPTPTVTFGKSRTATLSAYSTRTTTSTWSPCQTPSLSRSITISRTWTAVHRATRTPPRTPASTKTKTPPDDTRTLTAAVRQSPPDRIVTVSASLGPTSKPISSIVPISIVAPTNARMLPSTATVAAGGVAVAATVVSGMIGMPIASRPAVVGAALRLSTCIADGDGPDVPSYVALPVQVPVYSAPIEASAVAVGMNAAFVVLTVVGAWMATSRHAATAADINTSSVASIAHTAATVPFSYIAPAAMEFSMMWLTASAADGLLLGINALGFVAGLVASTMTWAVLLWKARTIASSPPPRHAPWRALVGPLLASTRDIAAPQVCYAFFVELGCGLIFSAVSGIRVESMCVAKCIAATLVALAFLGYLLMVQPAAERMDHWFGVAFAALQLATGAAVTAAVVGSRGARESEVPWTVTALDAADTIGLATLALLVFQTGLNLITSVRERAAKQTTTAPTAAASIPASAAANTAAVATDHATHPLLQLRTVEAGSHHKSPAVCNPLLRIPETPYGLANDLRRPHR
jgi:hypothetical protein